MRRVLALVMTVVFLAAAMGAAVPDTLTLAPAVEGWADSYIAFLDSNYDIFAALWPDGMGGAAFMDLDLDGTPEMVLFDQGASVSMGAHIFDLINGQVYCVSSALDSAAGAFTMEAAWDEIVRFDNGAGVLTPVSVCQRYLEFDMYSGMVVTESYSVGGVSTDNVGYDRASLVYQAGQDAGYEAKGVYRWDSEAYTASREGLLAMARDAAAAYVPITSTVTLASIAG